MFIGHLALGFGAKKYAPTVSLGILFLACQLADLVWPNLVLLGIETLSVVPGITKMTPLDFEYYPWSHSLVALLVWAVLFAGIYVVLQKSGRRAALIIGLLVLSHWFLDWLTHRPDMPLTPANSTLLGLGLWNIPAFSVPFELLLFGAGVWLYHSSTRALNRRGSIGLWVLVAFLVVVYIGNIFGPPPPSSLAVAWSAQAMWLIVIWGFWVDRNRSAS